MDAAKESSNLGPLVADGEAPQRVKRKTAVVTRKTLHTN
jgi:hypothetical protein